MLIAGVAALSILSAVLFSLGCEGSAVLWVFPAALVGSFLVLAGLAFLFLWAICAVVDLDKPQEKDSKFYRFVTNLYIQALPPLLGIRVHLKGMEQLPREGRFLLVCNHLSNADPVLLLRAFPKSQLAFISKRENQEMFLVGKVMHKLMCQLINRENDREALKTILKCISMIREDMVSVAVFPEGYCSDDGRLQHFRAGVFKIAMKTRVPIVVCTLQNTPAIFDNLWSFRTTDVQLHLVGVIPAEETQGTTAVALAQRAYDMMLTDLGPDFAPLEEETT